MKMLTLALSAAVLAFSSGAIASSSNDRLKVLQDACYLKQVLAYVPSTCRIKATSVAVSMRKLMVLSVCILSKVKSNQS